MTSPIIGIDLGTTFSLVSALSNGTPVLFPNALGEVLTPSAVSVTSDGGVLVGAPARARATTHPESTVLAFKRDMGTDRTWKIGPHSFTPQMLSALVLGELKKDAEAALGETVEEAVITVPAYFGDAQRQATRDAGELAGLKVERIINEPTAAALRYGLHERQRNMRAVVVDLGGGTFDVTVLEIVEGVIEIQATSGDARLGGEDFDELLAHRVAQQLRERHRVELDSPISHARLRDAAELAKRRLSSATSTRLILPELRVSGRDMLVDFEVQRSFAEEAWRPLLERLKIPMARALRDAQLRPEDVDEVLLVGGATRTPCVSALVAQFFGRLPLRDLPADEAVAQGAAVQAALKQRSAAVSDMVVTDIAPFSMGVATRAAFGAAVVDGVFSPILERGTVIPASRTQRFFTAADWQTAIHIEVFQGEHPSCDKNQRLGVFAFKNIRRRPAGEVSIDVRFTYDLNGILDVDVSEVDGGRTETFTLERTSGKLSPTELNAARERMKRLKVHPRTLLPNATALARADALYVELSGPAREHLSLLITAFKVALERQDPSEIDACRGALRAFIDGRGL